MTEKKKNPLIQPLAPNRKPMSKRLKPLDDERKAKRKAKAKVKAKNKALIERQLKEAEEARLKALIPKKNHSHATWIHNVMNDEQYAEEFKLIKQTMPSGQIIAHPDKYKPEFDQIAFDIMAEENGTITAVCVALKVTSQTLRRWIERHPTLRTAVNCGRLEGEVKFRKKMADHAYSPASQVNTGIIKILAMNVYGMEVDTPAVIVNNTNKNEVVVDGKKETNRLYEDVIDITPDS